jgi:hypothetical protein
MLFYFKLLKVDEEFMIQGVCNIQQGTYYACKDVCKYR